MMVNRERQMRIAGCLGCCIIALAISPVIALGDTLTVAGKVLSRAEQPSSSGASSSAGRKVVVPPRSAPTRADRRGVKRAATKRPMPALSPSPSLEESPLSFPLGSGLLISQIQPAVEGEQVEQKQAKPLSRQAARLRQESQTKFEHLGGSAGSAGRA
jgi:hypothetical protein